MKGSAHLNKSFGIPSSPEKSLEAPKCMPVSASYQSSFPKRLYQQMVRMKGSSYQINFEEKNCEGTCYHQPTAMLLGHCGKAHPSSLLSSSPELKGKQADRTSPGVQKQDWR